MNLIPLNERLVVARLDAERQSPGGIIIPDSAQKQSQRGLVLAVWNPYDDTEGKRHKSVVKEGDLVLMPKYSGEEFATDSGKKVILLKESELLAVIRDYQVVSDDEERAAG